MMPKMRYMVPVLAAVLTMSLARVAGAADHPNIVVIYADDLGYGDPACYNPEHGKIATPNIDRFVSQGMRFTDAHSSSGVCSPSRYTLLTGRYHWRTRLQRGIVGLWGAPLIAPDRLTIAGMLKQSGYRTACIGKWHLGWDWPIPEGRRKLFGGNRNKDVAPTAEQLKAWQTAFSQPIPGGPTSRGFDSYFGTDVPNWPPYCFIENDRTVGIPNAFLPARLFRGNLASQQGPALENWSLEQILPTLEARACAFIAEAAKATTPFFLYMPLTSPHTPLAVTPEWKGKSGLGPYGDYVMETDAVIGGVLDSIEATGEAGNTFVLFTSDNGCAPYIGVGELEAKGHYPSGPLRGYKSDAWDGGHRVAFAVRWPGVVKAGTTCGRLVHQADVLATCAAIVGAELPDTAGEDSFSLLPILKGTEAPVREYAVSHSMQGLPVIRKGKWKMIFGPGSGGWSKGHDDQPAQLYDVSADIGEQTNRYAELPELTAELTRSMATIVDNGRSTPGAVQKNDVAVDWRKFMKHAKP